MTRKDRPAIQVQPRAPWAVILEPESPLIQLGKNQGPNLVAAFPDEVLSAQPGVPVHGGQERPILSPGDMARLRGAPDFKIVRLRPISHVNTDGAIQKFSDEIHFLKN